jgi:hypothetical protein
LCRSAAMVGWLSSKESSMLLSAAINQPMPAALESATVNGVEPGAGTEVMPKDVAAALLLGVPGPML